MNFDEYRKKKQTIIEKLSCTKSIIVEPKLASEYDFKNYSKQISADIENLKNEEHRIVVVGSYGAGKTTFMKALLGFEHLPAKHGENTAALAYFRKANSNQLNGTVTVKLSESSTVELNALHDIYLFLETPGEDSPKRLDDVKKYFTDNLNEYYTDLGGFDPARDVLSVDVWLDNPLLNNDVVLIDSPGIGSVSRQHEAITREEIFRADAVIYLFNSNQLGGSGDEKFIGDILSITKNIMFTINKKDVVDKNPLNEESWDEIIQHLIVDLNRSKIINYDQFPGIIPFSAGYAWNVINEDQKALSAENNQLKKLGMPEYKNFDEMYIASNFEAVREKVERIATTVSNDQRGERSLKIDRYEESATNLTKRIIDILDTAHKNLKENEDSDYEAEISDYRAKIEELDKKSLKITEILKDNKKGEYETWFNIQKDQDLEKITARLNEINIDNAQNADNVAGVAAQLERIINSSRENYLNQIEQVIEDVGRDLNEEYAFEGLAHEIETIDMPTYDYDAEKVRGLEHELEELKKGYERTNTELKKHESKIDFNKNEIEGHKAHIDQAHKMIECKPSK